MNRYPAFAILPLCILLVLAALPAAAQSSQARQLLDATTTYLAGLDQYSFDIKISLHAEQGEKVEDLAFEGELKARGDADLYMRLAHTDQEAIVFSNKDVTILYDVTNKNYQEQKPAMPRENVMGSLPGGPFRVGSIWAALLLNNPEVLTGELVRQYEYVGEETLDLAGKQVLCEHIRLLSPNEEVDLWAEKGDTPLPRRLKLDLSRALETKLGPEAAPIMELTYDFSNWQTSPTLEDAVFAFDPPEGVELAKPPVQPAQDDVKLLGEPAPAIDIALLDGTEIDLAALKGKQVVILDFWATWCQPCRVAMPILEKVSGEFEDVTLYAINVYEPEDTVRQFLEKTGLGMKVALDLKGAAANSYGVTAFPSTVLIGKDGSVQAFHQGVSPAFEAELRRQLGTLVTGEKLVQ